MVNVYYNVFVERGKKIERRISLSKKDLGRETGMKFKGTRTWVCEETGEIQEVNEFEKPVGRTERFMITYLAEIINLIDNLGNKKMQVVKYILKNMSKADNTLIITTRELAEKTKVSKPVVLETLNILEKAGIIQRRTGAIMVSPKLMNNKRANAEAVMMVKFRQFSDNTEE